MTDDEPKPLPKTGKDGWQRTASARAKQWCRDVQERGDVIEWEWQEKDMSRGKVYWKEDFFQFADLVLVRRIPDHLLQPAWNMIEAELVAVQVTGGPDTSGKGQARIRKIKDEPKAAAWAATGAKIEVWEYRWRRKKGKVVAVERVVIPVVL